MSQNEKRIILCDVLCILTPFLAFKIYPDVYFMGFAMVLSIFFFILAGYFTFSEKK